MSELVDFLLARIAEDEAPTFELIPYRCPPGCCAPAGYVGHRCLICATEEFGGTSEAITSIAREHDKDVHRRTRTLAECKAKRAIVQFYCDERSRRDIYQSVGARAVEDEEQATIRRSAAARCRGLEIAVELLASPYANHPDYRQEWRPNG